MSMSYIHNPNTSPLEHRTLFQLLDNQAAKFPEKEAIIFRDQDNHRKAITFQEYQQQSQSLAAKLLDIGLRRGDKVLVLLHSDFEFIISHIAVNRIGAVFIPIEVDAPEGIIELHDQIACVIYTHESKEMLDAVSNILDEDHFKAAIFVGSHVTPPQKKGVYDYHELLREGAKVKDLSNLKEAEAEVQFDDLALIIHTSGSTGRPKPILYTNHSLVNGALTAMYSISINQDSIVFTDAPLDWITGIGFVLSLVSILGTTYVMFPPNLAVKGGLAGTILKILEEEKCTNSIFLSYFFVDMTMYPEISNLDLSALKFCLTGGQLTDRLLLKKVFDAVPGLSIINGYGSTEIFISCRQVLTRENIDTIDYGVLDINPGFEVKVVDSDERIVPVETPGELYVRGAGILHSASGLKIEGVDYGDCKTSTGWYRTKDRVMITADGRMKILGRTDNLIKCATESIQPGEIESTLSHNEKIVAAVAIGIPDQRLYEIVCACVILTPDCCQDDEKTVIAEIDEWCSDKFIASSNGLSSQPRHYVVVDKYPTTRTGKTDRRALKTIAMEKLGMHQ